MIATRYELRRQARRFPRLANTLWHMAYPLFRRDETYVGDEYDGDNSTTFEQIYVENRWRSRESRSGDGSSLEQTLLLRRRLPRLMTELGAQSLLDAPCGDFNWMRAVTFPPEVTYTGGEIVQPLVDRLALEYSSPNRRFIKLDIVADPLPDADVWLCRDVLFHLSEKDIESVFKNFMNSNIRYLLTTTYDFIDRNEDIRTGGFRFINLRRAPYHLPAPKLAVDDFLAPMPPRKLGLWTRRDIEQAFVTKGQFVGTS